MKYKLRNQLFIVILVMFCLAMTFTMPSIARADGDTTTTITQTTFDAMSINTKFGPISVHELNAKMVIGYWTDTDGESEFGTALAVPFAQWSKVTSFTVTDNATTFHRQQIASIGLLTDVNKHYDIYASLKLLPVKKWVDNKIGMGGDMSFPVVDVLMTKFFDPEIVGAFGKNIETGAWEGFGGLVIFQASQ